MVWTAPRGVPVQEDVGCQLIDVEEQLSSVAGDCLRLASNLLIGSGTVARDVCTRRLMAACLDHQVVLLLLLLLAGLQSSLGLRRAAVGWLFGDDKASVHAAAVVRCCCHLASCAA